MTRRQLVPLVVLCGTIALGGWGAASLGVFASSSVADLAIAPTARSFAAMSVGEAASADPGQPETGFALAGLSAVPVPNDSSPDARPAAQPEPRVRLVSLGTLREMKEYPKPPVRPIETADECLVADICIDEYLWSLY